ncbi:MAG TPA: biliverdin-producing heme oxygenase [Alphaproteobacteria bacterium]|nr:biliverdin-producing heme oxygenase [Alphaproteobacteria bacterium]
MNQIRQILRTATARHHERVDAAFAGFDLRDAGSYRCFLSAHARVLPGAENAIHLPWDGWTRRAPLLLRDLSDLGAAPEPSPANLSMTEPAAQWGCLYVLEGSRLGGSVLAQRVVAGLPTRYLSAGHTGGSWRIFQTALEAAAGPAETAWIEAAVAAARSVFELFEEAARLELGQMRGR